MTYKKRYVNHPNLHKLLKKPKNKTPVPNTDTSEENTTPISDPDKDFKDVQNEIDQALMSIVESRWSKVGTCQNDNEKRK